MRPLVWLRRKIKRGFSLLEVMVAVAILGGSLVVILSAQTGLAASNRSAANMGQAVELGRCKMTEVEGRAFIPPVLCHTNTGDARNASGSPIPSPHQVIIRIGEEEIPFFIERNPRWP